MALPPTLRTLPWNPIDEMWCWPQPFGQPLILMVPFPRGTIATRSERVLRYSVSARPSPRDCVTARRQLSAPGQLTTSPSVLASAAPRSAAAMRS